MIEIKGIFRNHTVTRVFNDVLDAIEFRDLLDAQYATVVWRSI